MDGVGENSVVSIEEEDDKESKGGGARKLDDRPDLDDIMAWLAGDYQRFEKGQDGEVGDGREGAAYNASCHLGKSLMARSLGRRFKKLETAGSHVKRQQLDSDGQVGHSGAESRVGLFASS